jgi:hypothetical protein
MDGAKRGAGDVNTIILDAPYSRFLIWEQYDTKHRTVSEARKSRPSLLILMPLSSTCLMFVTVFARHGWFIPHLARTPLP